MSTEHEWGDWPSGYARVILAETDSTNAEAARRAPLAELPTWILALRQTAARARRGRRWESLKGNFSATLLLSPPEPLASLALRGFVAGLALYDALAAVTGRTDPFALKWPNDMLLDGGKLAGILLESLGSGRSARHLAIGIGVNLAEAPDAADVEAGALKPVSLFGCMGHSVSPENLLAALAPAFAFWERKFAECGFAPIRETWLARAAGLGRTVTARMPSEEITGVFETVDSSGALVLRTADARRAVSAADVYL